MKTVKKGKYVFEMPTYVNNSEVIFILIRETCGGEIADDGTLISNDATESDELVFYPKPSVSLFIF